MILWLLDKQLILRLLAEGKKPLRVGEGKRRKMQVIIATNVIVLLKVPGETFCKNGQREGNDQVRMFQNVLSENSPIVSWDKIMLHLFPVQTVQTANIFIKQGLTYKV